MAGMLTTRFAWMLIAGLALGTAGLPAGHAADRPSPQPRPGGAPPLPGEGTQDEDFLKTAPPLLRPTIEISRLGAEKGENPDVVALSRKMADSYSQLLENLENAARAAGKDVPAVVDPHGTNRLTRLQAASSAFDLTYLTEQRGLHSKMAAIFSMEERAGENASLKQLAEKGRRMFDENLATIEGLEARLAEKRTTPGR